MGLRRLYKSAPRLRRTVRRVKNESTFAAVRGVLAIVGRLSFDRAIALADRAGDLLYAVLPGTRRLALRHIEEALGDELTPTARKEIVRAAFRNVGRTFVEVVKFEDIRPRLDDYVDVEGWEHVEKVRQAGGGAIAITGHIGNWELLAAYVASRGVPVGAIAKRIYEPRLNAMIVDFRARNGVQTILRESPNASREMLRILRSGGLLAMLIDQDTRVPSVSVPFFGRAARTPAGAAALAIRRELPVLAFFTARRPGQGHRISVVPVPFEYGGDRKRDVVELTRKFNAVIEERIRRNPAEWVWWHRRWRRGPIPRLDLDGEGR